MEIKIEMGEHHEEHDEHEIKFALPVDEIQQDLEVGQKGYVRLPVEVVAKEGGMIYLRKRAGKASSDSWTQQSLQDIEDEIGIADESERE